LDPRPLAFGHSHLNVFVSQAKEILCKRKVVDQRLTAFEIAFDFLQKPLRRQEIA
jgi:hypothetical protein